MIIKRIDEYFCEANHVNFDDFEFIVTASNIAGYLETKDKINIESDTKLTEFILSKYEYWSNKEWKNYSFADYISDELKKEFGFKED